jgi:uncharacterized protein
MNNPASSFHAERSAQRWYRQRWPWLLIAGPAIVVVASLTSAWLAIVTDDGLVADDYYKQGLLINRKLGATPATAPEPSAIVVVGDDGQVRAHLTFQGSKPTRVWFTLRHPGAQAQVFPLVPEAGDVWTGTIAAQSPGRWIVSLESDLWQLPVTTVQGHLGEFTLGAAHALR